MSSKKRDINSYYTNNLVLNKENYIEQSKIILGNFLGISFDDDEEPVPATETPKETANVKPLDTHDNSVVLSQIQDLNTIKTILGVGTGISFVEKQAEDKTKKK